MARSEDFVAVWQGIGRPPRDRRALANGFIAKAVLGLTTTVALIERLTVDIEFDPAESVRYCERTVAERVNARLKDEFGRRHIWVKDNNKIMSHLMFGLLVLMA